MIKITLKTNLYNKKINTKNTEFPTSILRIISNIVSTNSQNYNSEDSKDGQ